MIALNGIMTMSNSAYKKIRDDDFIFGRDEDELYCGPIGDNINLEDDYLEDEEENEDE